MIFYFEVLKGLNIIPPSIPSSSQGSGYQLYPCMYQFLAAKTDFLKAKEKKVWVKMLITFL